MMTRPLEMMDMEVFRDFVLVKWRAYETGLTTSYAMWPGQSIDLTALRAHIARVTAVTFNGWHYDQIMLRCVLMGYSCEQCKYVSDAIIQRNLSPWDVEREFQLLPCPELDMIDLFEIPPRAPQALRPDSLKSYMGKMHCRTIQDLPLAHWAPVLPFMRKVIDDYCGNDLEGTAWLYKQFATQIQQRIDIGEEYGIDVRSKSDAQISEAIVKKQLSFKPQRPNIPAGTRFTYDVPSWIYFQTPELQKLLEVIKAQSFVLGGGGAVLLPEALEDLRVKVGSNSYTVRIGGLHSCETVQHHVAREGVTQLVDIDVASWYPRLIDVLGLFPEQIGPGFLAIFRKLIRMRLAAKKAGNKKLADMLKIVINGCYGKLGSPFSVLFAPKLMLQVTITGQLALLMLIEAMELNNIRCVSANTDGIVLKYNTDQDATRLAVMKWWESVTQAELEAAPYLAIFIRDVNSYVAFKPDGTVKKKGEFADPIPVASSWPSPECQVSVDAMVEFLRSGTPVEQTVRACRDVRQFVAVRKVTGGGLFRGQQLGRAVRWYYSKAGGVITNTKGGQVANGAGVMPMMTLTDELPLDLDHDYYITRAKKMLLTVGVTLH